MTSSSHQSQTSPGAFDCRTCAACCASFRVEFSMYETVPYGGNVPASLCESAGGARVRMLGTAVAPIRCVALLGQVGQATSCSIYEHRARPCRSLIPGDEQCKKARTMWLLDESA